MTNRVDGKRKPKPGSREDKPPAFRTVVVFERLFASPDERAALDAAEAELDRAAEALAALVPPEAFKVKLADLARGRAARGRPSTAGKKQTFVRFLIEASGDVDGTGPKAKEVIGAVAECVASALGRASKADLAAHKRMAQEVRRELAKEHETLPALEAAAREAFAVSALEGLDWPEREKKAIEIFLARIGANDVLFEESPGAPRRRAHEGLT